MNRLSSPDPERAKAGGYEFLPDTTDWLGRHRPVQRAENDYLLDPRTRRK
jgi:hypothetical protein